MWTCSKCATKVDPSFDVCWNCGTTADGIEDPTFVVADETSPNESPLDLDMPQGDSLITQPLNEEAGELVEAYSALDLLQAKFLADKLSEQGIPAVCDLHDLHDALGSMNSNPKVWVRAGDLMRARLWLADFERQNQEDHKGDA